MHWGTSVPGYQQANVVILPSRLADDFEEFCCRNPGPLPLLYRSKSGETSCWPLAEHADIRCHSYSFDLFMMVSMVSKCWRNVLLRSEAAASLLCLYGVDTGLSNCAKMPVCSQLYFVWESNFTFCYF